MILTYNIAKRHSNRHTCDASAQLRSPSSWRRPRRRVVPDQDKEWIVTRQHVDAPIPVWHDDTNSFSLNTINMPMEKTALWIPKAWTGTGEKDEAKSQLVIPAKRLTWPSWVPRVPS